MAFNLIEVTDTRAISCDVNNWMLLRRIPKTDKETGEPIGGYSDWGSYAFYGSFKQAAGALEEEFIRNAGATSVKELKDAAAAIHEFMMETLDAADKLVKPKKA